MDTFHKEALLKMGIGGVYIREGEEDEENEEKGGSVVVSVAVQKVIEKNTVQDRAKVNLSESVKARVAEGIQYLYNDTESEGFTDTTKNITDDLM